MKHCATEFFEFKLFHGGRAPPPPTPHPNPRPHLHRTRSRQSIAFGRRADIASDLNTNVPPSKTLSMTKASKMILKTKYRQSSSSIRFNFKLGQRYQKIIVTSTEYLGIKRRFTFLMLLYIKLSIFINNLE